MTFINKKYSKFELKLPEVWNDDERSYKVMLNASQDTLRMKEMVKNTIKAHHKTVVFV